MFFEQLPLCYGFEILNFNTFVFGNVTVQPGLRSFEQ